MDIRELRKKLNKKKADKVPEGWYTSKEIAKMSGISEARARSLTLELYKNGFLEKKCFRILTPKSLAFVTHYREIKGNTKITKGTKK